MVTDDDAYCSETGDHSNVAVSLSQICQICQSQPKSTQILRGQCCPAGVMLFFYIFSMGEEWWCGARVITGRSPLMAPVANVAKPKACHCFSLQSWSPLVLIYMEGQHSKLGNRKATSMQSTVSAEHDTLQHSSGRAAKVNLKPGRAGH